MEECGRESRAGRRRARASKYRDGRQTRRRARTASPAVGTEGRRADVFNRDARRGRPYSPPGVAVGVSVARDLWPRASEPAGCPSSVRSPKPSAPSHLAPPSSYSASRRFTRPRRVLLGLASFYSAAMRPPIEEEIETADAQVTAAGDDDDRQAAVMLVSTRLAGNAVIRVVNRCNEAQENDRLGERGLGVERHERHGRGGRNYGFPFVFRAAAYLLSTFRNNEYTIPFWSQPTFRNDTSFQCVTMTKVREMLRF